MPWREAADLMVQAITAMTDTHFSQPIKPYLMFENPLNRIIAMPAYLGGDIGACGLKWIASFPENLEKGLQRAHSNTILNHPTTGKPLAFFNTAYISGVRTAAVTGMVMEKLLHARPRKPLKIGIAGFGPIGQLHLEMTLALLGDQVEEVRLFDLREIDEDALPLAVCPIKVVRRWQDAYVDADVFMTCTVAKSRWINLPAKPGSLQLNVSLRDYEAEIAQRVDTTLVDDWDEVCRAGTDIEVLHNTSGLKREDTMSLLDLFNPSESVHLSPEATVMFHPMGLAIFDIILAQAYYQLCLDKGLGLKLPESDTQQHTLRPEITEPVYVKV